MPHMKINSVCVIRLNRSAKAQTGSRKHKNKSLWTWSTQYIQDMTPKEEAKEGKNRILWRFKTSVLTENRQFKKHRMEENILQMIYLTNNLCLKEILTNK